MPDNRFFDQQYQPPQNQWTDADRKREAVRQESQLMAQRAGNAPNPRNTDSARLERIEHKLDSIFAMLQTLNK